MPDTLAAVEHPAHRPPGLRKPCNVLCQPDEGVHYEVAFVHRTYTLEEIQAEYDARSSKWDVHSLTVAAEASPIGPDGRAFPFRYLVGLRARRQ